MRNPQNKEKGSHATPPEPVCYEILVQGLLDPPRAEWFEGMTLTPVENGEHGLACTRITGPIVDQPALHGLLAKIRDLNLTLLSVRRISFGDGSMSG